jgi:hypothetical protein
MLPAKRNKVDLSVRTGSLFAVRRLTVWTGVVGGGEEAVWALWQAADTQEHPDEHAERGARGLAGAWELLTRLQDRKYFDSGDYALSKAGVAPQSNVGTAIPNPEK